MNEKLAILACAVQSKLDRNARILSALDKDADAMKHWCDGVNEAYRETLRMIRELELED